MFACGTEFFTWLRVTLSFLYVCLYPYTNCINIDSNRKVLDKYDYQSIIWWICDNLEISDLMLDINFNDDGIFDKNEIEFLCIHGIECNLNNNPNSIHWEIFKKLVCHIDENIEIQPQAVNIMTYTHESVAPKLFNMTNFIEVLSKFMSLIDWCSMRGVCQKYYQLSNVQDCYEHFSTGLLSLSMSLPVVQHISRSFQHKIELTIDALKLSITPELAHKQTLLYSMKWPKIQYLTITSGNIPATDQLDDGVIQLMNTNIINKCKHINIKYKYENGSHSEDASSRHEVINNLNLVKCEYLKVTGEDEHDMVYKCNVVNNGISHMSLNNINIDFGLFNNCANLTYLELDAIKNENGIINDELLRSLEYLVLGGIDDLKWIYDNTLQNVLYKLNNYSKFKYLRIRNLNKYGDGIFNYIMDCMGINGKYILDIHIDYHLNLMDTCQFKKFIEKYNAANNFCFDVSITGNWYNECVMDKMYRIIKSNDIDSGIKCFVDSYNWWGDNCDIYRKEFGFDYDHTKRFAQMIIQKYDVKVYNNFLNEMKEMHACKD